MGSLAFGSALNALLLSGFGDQMGIRTWMKTLKISPFQVSRF